MSGKKTKIHIDPGKCDSLLEGIRELVRDLDGKTVTSISGLHSRLKNNSLELYKRVATSMGWKDDRSNEDKEYRISSCIQSRGTFDDLFSKNVAKPDTLTDLERLVSFALQNGTSDSQSRKHSAGEHWKQIKEASEIRVGWLPYDPFVDAPPPGSISPTGFYPFLLSHAAHEYGLRVTQRMLTWSEFARVTVFDEGLDLVCCCAQTPQRRKRGDFVCNYYKTGLGGLVRRGSSIKTVLDLWQHKVKIVVHEGEMAHDVLGHLVDGLDVLKITGDDIFEAAASLLEGKKADIVLADALSCERYVQSKGQQGRKKLHDAFRSSRCVLENVGILIPFEEPELALWLENNFKAGRDTLEGQQHERGLLRAYREVIHLNFENLPNKSLLQDWWTTEQPTARQKPDAK